MGWERGYYYRVRKEGGRVVREYVGNGRVAELAAQLDALDREKRQLDRLELIVAKAELADLDDDMKNLAELTELAARAALLAAGFHRHNRGGWRKRRDQETAAES